MTKKELNQLHYLNREIKMLNLRLKELRNSSVVKGQEITGMPCGSGKSDNAADMAVNIVELERLIELKREQCEIELVRLTRYINSIKDSYIRQILTYRYIYSYTWNRIAYEIGGNNAPDGIRKTHDRFLKKSSKK